MMNVKMFMVIILISNIACSSKKITKSNIVTDNYGYDQNEPINVGGSYTSGVANQRAYLNSLSGPNGEEVSFVRVGSCCHFKTKNSSFRNSGLLDIYKVTYTGKGDTVRLYLNLYDEEPVRVPLGFKFR